MTGEGESPVAGGMVVHHGGAWKVAYADFVTAMMALFIVLWLLSQTDEKLREDIAEYFRTGAFSGAPSLLGSGAGLLDGMDLDVRGNSLGEEELLKQSAAELKRTVEGMQLEELDGNVQVKVVDEGLLIQIIDGGNELMFDLSSSELKPELVELLEKLAPILGKLPNSIQVHGHTDARPFPRGSGRTNWDLSFERADNARQVLELNGLRKGQLQGVFAHGDTSLYDADPFSAKNRRLAILAVRRSLVAAGPAPGAAKPARALPRGAKTEAAPAKPKLDGEEPKPAEGRGAKPGAPG